MTEQKGRGYRQLPKDIKFTAKPQSSPAEAERLEREQDVRDLLEQGLAHYEVKDGKTVLVRDR